MLAAAGTGRHDAERRRDALANFSMMVGAILLARAVDDAEPPDELLRSARQSVAQWKPAPRP